VLDWVLPLPGWCQPLLLLTSPTCDTPAAAEAPPTFKHTNPLLLAFELQHWQVYSEVQHAAKRQLAWPHILDVTSSGCPNHRQKTAHKKDVVVIKPSLQVTISHQYCVCHGSKCLMQQMASPQ
jgi:hypothetical protein